MIGLKNSNEIAYNGTENECRFELYADTAADLQGVTHFDGIKIQMGSECTDIATGDKYLLNGSGVWVLQPSANVWDNVYTKTQIDTMINAIYQTMMYYHTAQESANGSITFYTLGTPVGSLTIYGNGQQTGTPTPDNPVMPTFCGVRTANLIDESKVTPNAYISNTGATGSSSVSNLSDFIDINGSPFAISGVRTTDILNTSTRALCYFDSDKNIISGTVYDPDVMAKPTSFLHVPQNARYVRFAFDKAFENGIMLNLGRTALPYEPFGHKIPISCGGETVPVYLGQTPTVRRIKKYIFTGEENITDIGEYYNTNVSVSSRAWGITISTTGGFQISNVGNSMWASKAHFSDYTTPDALKTYLQQQYAAGHPVTVWYVLETPETGIVSEPLAKIGDYADELHITDADVSIPTVSGENTLTVDTTLPPSKIVISGE